MAKLSGLYAAALFELIMEGGKPEDALPQAVVLRDTLAEPDCRRVLVHPHIPAEEKRGFFTGAFAGNLDANLLAFISLVIDKNRETFAVPALNELIGLLKGHLKMTTAKVASAADLTAKQAGSLKKVLEEKLGKQVELELKTDQAVIGGAHIQADGFFLDRTVKRQLTELKGAMSL